MKVRVFSAMSRQCLIIAAAFVVLCGVTAQYKIPETTIDPRSTPDVEVDAPQSSPLGASLNAVITIRNTDTQERDFTCYLLVRAVAQNGNEIGVVSGPRTDLVTIGVGGTAVVNANVAWNQLKPFVSATEFIEFDVVVTRVHDEQRWFRQRVSVIRGLPLTIALEPTGHGGQPNDLAATVTCSNPLEVPLNAGTLTLAGGPGLLINGTARSEEIPVGPLASGETATCTRTLSASTLGEQTVFARWFVPVTVPGESTASINGEIAVEVDPATVESQVVTKRVGRPELESIRDDYKAAPLRSPPDVSLDAPSSLRAGQDLVATLTIRNPFPTPRTYRVGIGAYATSERGDFGETLSPSEYVQVVVPGNDEIERVITIPAALAQARIMDSRWIRLGVTAIRDEDFGFWAPIAPIMLEAVSVNVAIAPGVSVRPGQALMADVEIINHLPVALEGALLGFTASSRTLRDARADTNPIDIPSLPPGASINFQIPFTATREGEGFISVIVFGASRPLDSWNTAIFVSLCPCDFNGNRIQEIDDYFEFITAFIAQLGGPGSADFDGDGIVTIDDYFAFLECMPAIAASTPCP